MKYSVIFSDFDGTLVDKTPILNPATVEAIKQFIGQGGKFYIATGRDYCQPIQQACLDLGLTGPQITSGGAEIVEAQTGQLIIGHYIDNEVVKQLVGYLGQQPCNIYVSHQGALYTNNPQPIAHSSHELLPIQELIPVSVPKIRVTIKPELLGSMQEYMDKLQHQFAADVVIHQSHTANSIGFDITSPKATKHLAVLQIIAMHELDHSLTVGMGDGYNDFPLLSACQYKVAMNHAPQELKDIADYIAPSHEEGGPTSALQHIMSL